MGAGPAVHGIEVVDQGLHGLITAFLGFGVGVAHGQSMDPAVDGLVSDPGGGSRKASRSPVSSGVVLSQAGEETRFLPMAVKQSLTSCAERSKPLAHKREAAL